MIELNTPISPVNISERKKIDLRSGYTVRVWQKIKEGDKTRLQAFEGLVIARKHGKEPGATFTVRRVSSGSVGVEKIFPLYSPKIDKIEILKRSKVRRAKLYYIKEKAAKEIRKKMRKLRIVEEEEDSAKGIESKDDLETKSPSDGMEIEEVIKEPTLSADRPVVKEEETDKKTGLSALFGRKKKEELKDSEKAE